MAIMFLASSTANANDVAAIEKGLSLWNPKSVTLSDGVLEIVTQERRVSDQVYNAVVKGVCGSLWLNPSSWSGVKEMRILNQWKKQGYVFEGGEAECVELGKLSGKEFEFYILGKTHLY